MESVHEVILSYCTLTGNDGIVGYPQMREAARLSWYKLFQKTRESQVRKWVDIIDGEAQIPETLDKLLGVYIEDDCGNVSPLYEDNYINTLERPKLKCTCTQCDVDECLCPTVSDIPVYETVNYNGNDYINKSVSRILKSGEVVVYKETWIPSYDSDGLLVEVVLDKTQSTSCNVLVKSCGCVDNCNENASMLIGCGCVTDFCVPYLRERYPVLYNRYGYYKFDRQQNKLFIFDNEGYLTESKQIILSFQSNGEDMMVPEYARPVLIALLDWTKKQYSPLFRSNEREDARRYYARQKNDMLRYLHPIPFELITQAGDYNAMDRSYRLSYNSQNVSNMRRRQSCNLLEPCVTPVASEPIVNNITHTTVINQGISLFYDFDVAEDGWQSAIINVLEGKTILNITVDGIRRKFLEVGEGDVTPPADGTFKWKKISGELIYRTSLNQLQWVAIEYKN